MAEQDTTAIQQQTTTTRELVDRMTIADGPEYLSAGETLKGMRRLRKQIAETFDGPINAAHAAHKAIVAARKHHDDPVIECENIVKGKMSEYQAEQERLRMAEERRLRDIAHKEEEERRLEQAAQLEKEGQAEQAQAVIERPIETPVVVLPKATPKVAGVSTRKIWKFRIVDPTVIPLAYMLPNERALGSLARSLGAQASVPGVEFYSEDSVAVSA